MEAIPLLTQLSTVPTKVARSTTNQIQQLVEKQQCYRKDQIKNTISLAALHSRGDGIRIKELEQELKAAFGRIEQLEQLTKTQSEQISKMSTWITKTEQQYKSIKRKRERGVSLNIQLWRLRLLE
jgi:Rad3-related DNA helicase